MDSMNMTEGMMKGPDGSILRFYYTSAKNEGATKYAGRAIFDTVLMVDVITPGQQSSQPSFEVERIWSEQSKEVLNTEAVSKRYPKYEDFREQVERFKANTHSDDMGGTPLSQWPRIDRGLAASLAALNIHTVEQFAAISDGNLQNIGTGARELREQAKAFLALAQGSAPVSQLTEKVDNLTVENQRLNQALALANQQVSELQRQIGQLTGAPPPPPATRKLVDITLGD